MEQSKRLASEVGIVLFTFKEKSSKDKINKGNQSIGYNNNIKVHREDISSNTKCRCTIWNNMLVMKRQLIRLQVLFCSYDHIKLTTVCSTPVSIFFRKKNEQ